MVHDITTVHFKYFLNVFLYEFLIVLLDFYKRDIKQNNAFSKSFFHKYSLQIIISVFKAQQQFELEQSKTAKILLVIRNSQFIIQYVHKIVISIFL